MPHPPGIHSGPSREANVPVSAKPYAKDMKGLDRRAARGDAMQQKVVVFGSFVVDLMARGPHLPVPGETVKGNYFQMGPGGK